MIIMNVGLVSSLHLVTTLIIYLSCFTIAQEIIGPSHDYQYANLNTSWTITSSHETTNFSDGTVLNRVILKSTIYGPTYACGFYCKGKNCAAYVFGVFIVVTNSGGGIILPYSGFPQLVWSANRNKPVGINSTLDFTSQGDLVLKDGHGAVVWSTNTSGKKVQSLKMDYTGNLMLIDKNNAAVWQSFDEPTDALVPGQRLRIGQKLVAGVSTTNSSGGMFSVSMSRKGLFARVESNSLQIYGSFPFGSINVADDSVFVEYLNGSLGLFINSLKSEVVVVFPPYASAQYVKLGSDGHLKVYEWSAEWREESDLLSGYIGVCGYPQVCGEYGICSNGQCSCPTPSDGTTYFRQRNDRQPVLGCFRATPLSCENSRDQRFLELVNISYFSFDLSYLSFGMDYEIVDLQACREKCAKNCSCTAALFHQLQNSSGYCYLLSQVFSFMNYDTESNHYGAIAYVKVQGALNTNGRNRNHKLAIVLGATIASVFALILLGGAIALYIYKKKPYNKDNRGEEEELSKTEEDEEVEDYLNQLSGMPTRFSYAEMRNVTEDFHTKLGEGAFGAVFKGTLADGLDVAVKYLDGVGRVKRSFLAEVETIGSVHHVNLVKLVGFCVEKSHRLLVYEYMPNGSLDRWIFNRNNESALVWNQRKKVIIDIAKGLNYLHEDCRQKIIHSDIKPQNILLTASFDAKISDFGSSKLIERHQSQAVTNAKGTPGYMAPEWLSSTITEKVDVFSFGVVILEVVCGRKVVDRSQNEEDVYLLDIFQRKAEAGELLDMADKHKDMRLHGADILRILKIAAWCLQGDSAKRPSMSTVLKVLDGVMEVDEDGISYGFSTLFFTRSTGNVRNRYIDLDASTSVLPSVLSGPR